MAFDKEKQTAMETVLRNTAAAVTGEKARSAGLNIQMEANQCVDAANQLKQGIYEVMMLGAFNTGKSTVINALLGKSVLPDSVKPCTAIISQLQYSTEKNGQVDVFLKDGGVVNYSYDDFKEKYKYTEADEKEFKMKNIIKRFADVSKAIVYSNLGILQNGVQIVDTPGLKNNSQDNLLSMTEAKKANAIIFLLCSDRNFDQDERDYIAKNYAGKNLKNVFFLVTKFDYMKRAKDQDDVKQRSRSELEKVFTNSNGKFDEDLYAKRVFFVSALNTLISRDEHSGEEDAEFSKFEKELEIFLQNDEKAHQVYKDDIARIAATAKATNNYIKLLQDLQQTSDADFEERINKVLSEIQNLKERTKSLESVFAATKNACNAIIDSEFKKCVSDLKEGWPAKLSELDKEKKFDALDTIGVAWNKLWGGLRKFGNFFKSIFTGDDYDEISEKIDHETELKITEAIKPLTDDIIEYIQGGFDDAGKNIQTRIDKHAHDLAESIESIRGEIARIAKDLKIHIDVFGDSTTSTPVDIYRLIVAAIIGDWSQFITIGSGDNAKWGEFISKAIKQMLVDMIGYAILGPWGIVIAEVVQLMNGAEDRQTQFYKSMFDKGILGTETQIEKITLEWQNSISTNFKVMKDKILVPLYQKLSDLEKTLGELSGDKTNNADKINVKINTARQIVDEILDSVRQPLNGVFSNIITYSTFTTMI